MPKSFHSEEYAAFIQKLVEARQRAGITQAELAKRLGRHQSFVSNFESRVRRLDIIETIVVARILGLNATSMINELSEQVGPETTI